VSVWLQQLKDLAGLLRETAWQRLVMWFAFALVTYLVLWFTGALAPLARYLGIVP
jgi:hypothetical protein